MILNFYLLIIKHWSFSHWVCSLFAILIIRKQQILYQEFACRKANFEYNAKNTPNIKDKLLIHVNNFDKGLIINDHDNNGKNDKSSNNTIVASKMMSSAFKCRYVKELLPAMVEQFACLLGVRLCVSLLTCRSWDFGIWLFHVLIKLLFVNLVGCMIIDIWTFLKLNDLWESIS